MTFRELAAVYRERHVIPKRLTLAKEYDWSVKPYLERFGDRALVDIRTADVQDFIADLRKPRAIHRRPGRRMSASMLRRTRRRRPIFGCTACRQARARCEECQRPARAVRRYGRRA